MERTRTMREGDGRDGVAQAAALSAADVDPVADAALDASLMRAWIDGDADAFDALYARHRAPLYRFVVNAVGERALADELFQDVWLRVVGARAGWSPDAPFRAWLYRIARNRLIDAWRRDGGVARHESFDEESVSDVIEISPPLQPDEIARLAERGERLDEALLALPPAQREALLLRHVAGMSLAEIADVVGAGAETVKSRLRYGLIRLRRALRGAAA